MVRPLVVLPLLAASGCAGGEARTFAATLVEPLEMACRGETRHAGIEVEVLDDLAADLEEAYAAKMTESPPSPLGRVLHLFERKHEVQAWFDVAGSDPETVFAHAGVVYRGPPQDDFVEARFAVTQNTDAADADEGLELCGDRLLSEGVLSLTDGDGVQGRIRWRELTYVDTTTSRCLAWIECARNITVDGLPLD